LQQEIEQLKESLKHNQIINALEKSFYATSGKGGKDEDGLPGIKISTLRSHFYPQQRKIQFAYRRLTFTLNPYSL
jgi:hypothetical protein